MLSFSGVTFVLFLFRLRLYFCFFLSNKAEVLQPFPRYSRLVGPGKDFVAIWIPVGLSRGLSP